MIWSEFLYLCNTDVEMRDVESDGLIVFSYFMYLWLLIYTENIKYEVLFPLVKEWVSNLFLNSSLACMNIYKMIKKLIY